MNTLPEEVLLSIFDFLPRHCLVDVIPRVCSRWRWLAQSPVLWRHLDLGRDFDDDRNSVTTSFMLDRGLDSVVSNFELSMKNPLSDRVLENLNRVLRVCRLVTSLVFC